MQDLEKCLKSKQVQHIISSGGKRGQEICSSHTSPCLGLGLWASFSSSFLLIDTSGCLAGRAQCFAG